MKGRPLPSSYPLPAGITREQFYFASVMGGMISAFIRRKYFSARCLALDSLDVARIMVEAEDERAAGRRKSPAKGAKP